MTPKPWGKIILILLMSAGIMGLFVWKYQSTMDDIGEGVIGHVPTVLKPLYDIFGEKLYLVLGAAATLLFAVAGLKAVAGKPDIES